MSDALYTLAPASLTCTTIRSATPASRSTSRTNASVSRPPVPLPTAIADGAWRRTNSSSSRRAFSRPASPWLG